MISLKKQSKGFTIVELLIVIVVIGILAGLVITTYNGIQQKARNTERTTDLKTFQSQLEAYYANNGRYPDNDDLGTTAGDATADPPTGNLGFITTQLKGMDKETLRDPNGTGYALAVSGDGTVNKYTYEPTNDLGTACDDTGSNDCTHYKLIAVPEGSGDKIEFDSLN